MRVALDATPMLEAVSGIPVYCRELFAALGARADDDGLTLRLVAFSVRGRLPAVANTRRSPLRMPARLLRAAWSRSGFPPVEVVAGRCDVFHGTNFLSPPSVAAPVVTVHDLGFVRRPDTVREASIGYDSLLRRSLHRAPVVVVVPSVAVGLQVREHYHLEEERVVVTPLAPRGANAGAVDVRAPRGLPERYLIFIGTLEPRKNLDTLVAAQRLATARDDDHPPLVLVGASGWGGATGQDRSTIVLGRVDDDVLRSLLAGAAGLVMPSLDEGFGLPVLEAAAAGRPVAASDIPVMREVCAPGTLFCPPTDVEAWATTLADLAAAADGPTERASRRAHAASFTWDRCAEQTVAAYRRAVDLRG